MEREAIERVLYQHRSPSVPPTSRFVIIDLAESAVAALQEVERLRGELDDAQAFVIDHPVLVEDITTLRSEVVSLRAALREKDGPVTTTDGTPHTRHRWTAGRCDVCGVRYSDQATAGDPSPGQAALREAGGPEPDADWKQVATDLAVHLRALCEHPSNFEHRYAIRDGYPCPGCFDALIAFDSRATREAGQPTPPRCPTCGSDDPAHAKWFLWMLRCPDPWHAGQPTPEANGG